MIFRIKRKSYGSVNHYKARLVVKGFSRQSGIDYKKTFSLVIKAFTIRILLSIATTLSWDIQQLDVSNVFLHGILKDDIYMEQSSDFISTANPSFVCRLQKSLYGLKQAPWAWFIRLCQFLISLSFHVSKADSSLFIYHHSTDKPFLLAYVDDLILTINNSALITNIILSFKIEFPVREFGKLHYFLGIKVNAKNSLLLKRSIFMTYFLEQDSKMSSRVQCQWLALLSCLSPWVTPSEMALCIVMLLVHYNMQLSPGRTSIIQSTDYISSCMPQPRLIGRQLNAFRVI